MPVRLQWLDDLDGVAAIAGDTLDREEQARLYDRIDWFRATVEHGLAAAPLILSASDGDGAAYLFLARSGGRRATALASWYSLAFRPVTVAGGGSLLVPLFREAARRIDALTLAPILDGDRPAIGSALSDAGWRCFLHQASTNRTASVAQSDFAGWWAARPSRLRNTVARRRRTHPVSIALHDRFCPDAWEAYEAVYRASWKPAEGSMPFLRALAEQEGAAGTLRLGIARDAGGRAVAAQLWLVEGGRATIHKLAHREDARGGSPGSILSAAMFADAIDRDRVTMLDFGLGDDPYKADWMEDAAPVWRIDAFRAVSVAGAAGIMREQASRLVERLRGS